MIERIADTYHALIRRRKLADPDEFDDLLADFAVEYARAAMGTSNQRWRTAEEKAAAVAEYHAIVDRVGVGKGEVKALCRRRGIAPQTLRNWVNSADAALR